MASKQPQRSDLTSDLKFMTQTTYATMFVWTVLAFFGPNDGKKEERTHLPLRELSALPQLKIPQKRKCYQEPCEISE